MKLQTINTMGSWEWPPETGALVRETLADPQAAAADRLLAAKMAGNIEVLNDDLAQTLLTIAGNTAEPEELRCQAALALGPVLELYDLEYFDDPEETFLAAETFRTIQGALKAIYDDESAPELLRRRVLETAVRAPLPWHTDAIRAAYASTNEEWQLTAVFCMMYVNGFAAEILQALTSRDPLISYEAVHAAGNWGLKEAWPHIAPLLSLRNTDKALLIAAIDAAAGIAVPEANGLLTDLLDSDDDDTIDAVNEALAMIEAEQFADADADEA
jgi:hypothetical protein